MSGWIKLHRKLLEWEWYDDLPTFRLFTHLLLKVNFEKKKWRGIEILPGQIITGRKQLSEETGLTERQIRTSISRLKATNELTTIKVSKYTVYSILRWVDYQQNDHENDHKNDQRATTTKERKEYKNIKGSKLTLTQREQNFYHELKTYYPKYPKETLRAFYDYWTEPNRSNTKMRFELEKTWSTKRRLGTWARREKPSTLAPQKPPTGYNHIKPWKPEDDQIDPQFEKELMKNLKVLTT